MNRTGLTCILVSTALAIMAAIPAAATSYKALEAYGQANEAYAATNYAQAIRLYKTAEELNFTPATLYYNLGNAYYRSGKMGQAIVSYRRALRLDPRDPDITENLKTTRSQTTDGVAAPCLPGPVRSFLFVYHYIGFDELVWSCGILMVLLCLLAAIRIYLPQHWIKTLFICLLFLLLVAGASAGAHWYFTHVRASAVVTADESIVRVGPGDSFLEIFILHDGAEMRVLQREDDWMKIQIQIENEVKRGWIQQKDIEVI
jgi:tetratricopeptide (TPR) repeat protein